MRPRPVSPRILFAMLFGFGFISRAHGQSTAHGQRWEVLVDSARVTVGDPVTVRFRLQLDERDLLFDTLPKPVDSLLDGVAILSVERLVRRPNRDFVGSATIAFYRTGPQPVPVFGLPFMRAVKGISNGTIRSDTLSIEVLPVLAAGNPALRDIRETEPSRVPVILLGVVVLSVLGLIAVRFRRRRPGVTADAIAIEPESIPSPPAADPYAVAVARLDEIEGQGWSNRGEVARHYQSVVDVLRDYLESAAGVPARERTTAELFWSLPPTLLEGALRRQYSTVFEEADLVKFARWRPDTLAATSFLADARGLLARWHAIVEASTEGADAVR